MNMIDARTLKPGQIFSAPVYSEGKNVLVTAMVPLRQKDIDLLLDWGIDYVMTEGAIVPNANEDDEFVLDLNDLPLDISGENTFSFNEEEEETEPESEGVEMETKNEPVKFSISEVQQNSGPYRAYKNLIEKIDNVFTSIHAGIDMEMRTIDNICTQLLQDLRDYRDSFIAFILGGEISHRELAKSSVNAAILSTLTAQELHLPPHKILYIAEGALLHDIGMLRLARGITEKKGGLSEAELEQIKSHPMHSSKIITRELFGSHDVNLIALQHHERWDGKGYPDHIMGPAIDMGARIVSVADAFEAMVSKKSYRNSMGGYQAIKNLLADNSRRFDPAVITVFVKLMGIYPIGSIVKLNNGSAARVVSIHTDAPLRPVVQMLTDEAGNALGSEDAKTVDLLIQKTFFIKNAVEPDPGAHA